MRDLTCYINEKFFDNVGAGGGAVEAYNALKEVIIDMQKKFEKYINDPHRVKPTKETLGSCDIELYKISSKNRDNWEADIRKALDKLDDGYKLSFFFIGFNPSGKVDVDEYMDVYKDHAPKTSYDGAIWAIDMPKTSWAANHKVAYKHELVDEICGRLINEYYTILQAEAAGIKVVQPMALKTLTIK